MNESNILPITRVHTLDLDSLSGQDPVDVPFVGSHELGGGILAGHVHVEGRRRAVRFRAVHDMLILCPHGAESMGTDHGQLHAAANDGIFVPGGTVFEWCLPESFAVVASSLGPRYESKFATPAHLSATADLGIHSKARSAAEFNGPVPVQKKSQPIELLPTSSIGMWTSTPYDRKASTFGRNELMYLQRGTLGTGTKLFSEGELFLVPKGIDVGFVAEDVVRKIYWNWQ